MDLLSTIETPHPVDEPVGPEQYRHVATRAWWLGTFVADDAVHAHLTEHVLHRWVPARPEREWLLDHRVTGRVRWLSGCEATARAAGFQPGDGVCVGRFRAPHGDFHGERRGRPQGWHDPTPSFLAGLPRDPDTLLDRLVADHPPSRFAGPFAAAAATLRTCLAPADLRAALLAALCALPTVTVLDVADLDGRARTALVHDDGPTRTELLLDPATGQYAGERDTLRRDARCGLPAGTVIADTAVRTAVVDQAGALPA